MPEPQPGRPASQQPSYEDVIRRNPREKMKAEKFPLDIINEIPELIKRGYEAVPEEDLVRLQWWGLYHDKPRVGYFMMRIKIPNGILTPEQLRVIGEVSSKYGRNYCELSTRQNIQLHWISLNELPEAFEMLNSAGLTTAGGCGDVVRNITGCPVAGINKEELFEASPVAIELANFLYGNREYSNLPRKHKITVSACPYQCNAPEIHCIALIGVKRVENCSGRVGFTVRVGGGLSSSPRISRHMPVFVDIPDVIPVVQSMIDVWKEDMKYRQSFVRARIKFLIDDYGIDKFREAVEQRLGRKLEDHPELPVPPVKTSYPHLGVNEQKQEGLYYVGFPIFAGMVSGKRMISIADLAEGYGGGIRLTMQQNLILTDVPQEKLDYVIGSMEDIGLPLKASRLRQVSIACTGDPWCNYSVGDTKPALMEIVNHLESVGLGDVDLRINLDGCPHACCHHWVGDIGLQGTTARVPEGTTYAFDIILGGGYAAQASIGKPVARRVPAEKAKFYIERLIRTYLEQRNNSETFRDFCLRHSFEQLIQIMGGGDPAAMAYMGREVVKQHG